MKILILSLPRTGSTNLLESLSKSLNIESFTIPEGFEYPLHKKLLDFIINKKSFILRLDIVHYNHIKSFHTSCDFFKKFDSVILLSRKNEIEHYESIVNLYYKQIVLKTDCFSKYDINEIPSDLLKNFKNSHYWTEFMHLKKILNEVSVKYNMNILYYEELYYSDIGINLLKSTIPTLDIDKFSETLSKTKKIRTKIYKKII
jgi:hypothetical protein